MGYRIIETTRQAKDPTKDGVQIAEFDSAYRAMEEMRRAFIKGDSRPPPWYLVDPSGQVLLGPEDIVDVAA